MDMEVTSKLFTSIEGLTPTEARAMILPYIFRFSISNSRQEFVRTDVGLVNAINNSISFIQVRPINAKPILEKVVPASRSSIEAIPMVEVLGEGIDCSICLSGFQISEEAKEMPCKHHFHSICIDKWLGINGSCPICRYKMSVDEQCEKKGEESGGVERGDDGGNHMEEDGVKFIFHVIITPETTQLTVSITEVHRRSDDMFLEVGDCVVYEDVSEAGNGDESEARNGNEFQARNISGNGDGNESEARHGNVSMNPKLKLWTLITINLVIFLIRFGVFYLA